MGLLIDKYNEYLEKLRGVNLRPDDDVSAMDSDFNTSMGDGIKASLRERKSPLMDNPLFPTNIVPPGEGKINVAGASIPIIPKSAMGKKNISLDELMSDFFPNPAYDRGDKIVITELSEKEYKKREIKRLQEELEELEEIEKEE
jgi:hypothetical protein